MKNEIAIIAVVILAVAGLAWAHTMGGGCCGGGAHHTCAIHHDQH